jgi:PAS domain S-box-containing protein
VSEEPSAAVPAEENPLIGRLRGAVEPLLDRSADAVVILSPDAVVTYASPSAGRIFAWERSVVGTSALSLLHPDDGPTLTRSLQDVATDPTGARPVVELRVRAAGRWVWAEASLTSLLDDPQVRGVVCSVRRSLRREDHEAAEVRVAQLTTALQSRILIEQAKGFLAGRHGVAPAVGFEMLRGYARAHHLDIHEVSRQVLAGTLDLGPA